MAVTYVNEYTQIELQVHGDDDKNAYSTKEIYPILSNPGKTALKAMGELMSELRALTLPDQHEIRRVMGKKVGQRNQTIKLNPIPIPGAYPPDDIKAAAATQNTTLALGAPLATRATAAFTMQSAGELLIATMDQSANFRFEGESYTKQTRRFHGVPDFFGNDDVARGLSDTIVWYDGLTNAPTVVPTVADKWWDNFKPFFNWVLQYGCFVRQPGKDGIPAAPAGETYALIPYDTVLFEDIGKKQAGRPSDAPRGRVTLR